MKLPTHTIKPKPDMFYLTNRQIRTIHLSALAIAITNGVLAGMFIGRLITPDGGTAMDALFALAIAAKPLTLDSLNSSDHNPQPNPSKHHE